MNYTIAASPITVPSHQRVTHLGRDHIVVPVIMVKGDIVIRPLNSRGPEYVNPLALSVTADSWNGIPVVFNHPRNPLGAAITARTPEVIDRHLVGHVYNVRYENDALKGDMYIDLTRTDVGDALLDRITAATIAEPLEVSIGAVVVQRPERGMHNGQAYESVWEYVIPDHLAILPKGTPGACSVAMGCGAPRYNQAFVDDATVAAVDKEVTVMAATKTGARNKIKNLLLKAFVTDFFGEDDGDEESEMVAAGGDSPVADAPTGDEPTSDEPNSEIPAPEAPNETPVVEAPAETPAQPGGESTAVQAEAAPTTNEGGACMCATKELAGQLIANAAAPFDESQRATLEALGEDVLKSIVEKYEPAAQPAQPVTLAAGKPLTKEEFLAIAPPEVRALVDAAETAARFRRESVLAALAGKTAFSDDRLKAMPTDDLEALAQSVRATPPAVDYGLRGTPVNSSVALSAAERAVYTNPPDPWNVEGRIKAAAALASGEAKGGN